MYIQKELWLQIQNWSNKNFAFTEYLCRTLGNCCRLYGKHWETSAMINLNLNLNLASEHNCDSIRTYGSVLQKFQWQGHLETVYDIRSVVGGRYPNLHFLSQLNCFDIQHIYHILQVWELGQDVWISCPCKKKLGLTDRYVELWSKKVCLNRFNKSVPNILVCI